MRDALSKLVGLSSCRCRRFCDGIGPAQLWALFLGLGLHMALVGTAVSEPPETQKEHERSRIEAAWDKVYAAQVVETVPSQPPAEPAQAHEYLTLNFGADYTLQAVDFSGEPTVSFIVDGGPLTSSNVFESRDHKFRSYLSLGTRGLGHNRVNTYVSAILRSDLNGTTSGSPFQSILDDHDGTKFDLSNAYVEMNGLGTDAFLSHMSARVGRQFLPDFHVGFLGSSVMDGGRLAYADKGIDAKLFVGRWAPFYESTTSAFVGGGHLQYQLFPSPDSDIGLAPYVEYLYFNDTDQSMTSNRHTYGLRGRWKTLEAEGYFTAIDTDPIEIGLQANYVTARWIVYGRLRKRLSSDDFIFDVFLTDDKLERSNRLLINELPPSTDFTLDADYQLQPWLSVGAGLWVHALDHGGDQTGFDANFQEVTARVLVAPSGPWSVLVQYRYRQIDRGSTANVQLFDDTSRDGETRYNEVNAEVSYRWRRLLRVRVGGYYGVYDTQSHFANIDNTTVAGGYVRAKARVAKAVDVKFAFGLDRGNDEFNPDLDLQYMVQTGVEVSY